MGGTTRKHLELPRNGWTVESLAVCLGGSEVPSSAGRLGQPDRRAVRLRESGVHSNLPAYVEHVSTASAVNEILRLWRGGGECRNLPCCTVPEPTRRTYDRHHRRRKAMLLPLRK